MRSVKSILLGLFCVLQRKANEVEGDLGDFSSPEFQSQTDGELFYKTSFGFKDMPEYTKKMPDDEDRWLIVNYMRTLAE